MENIENNWSAFLSLTDEKLGRIYDEESLKKAIEEYSIKVKNKQGYIFLIYPKTIVSSEEMSIKNIIGIINNIDFCPGLGANVSFVVADKTQAGKDFIYFHNAGMVNFRICLSGDVDVSPIGIIFIKNLKIKRFSFVID